MFSVKLSCHLHVYFSQGWKNEITKGACALPGLEVSVHRQRGASVPCQSQPCLKSVPEPSSQCTITAEWPVTTLLGGERTEVSVPPGCSQRCHGFPWSLLDLYLCLVSPPCISAWCMCRYSWTLPHPCHIHATSVASISLPQWELTLQTSCLPESCGLWSGLLLADLHWHQEQADQPSYPELHHMHRATGVRRKWYTSLTIFPSLYNFPLLLPSPAPQALLPPLQTGNYWEEVRDTVEGCMCLEVKPGIKKSKEEQLQRKAQCTQRSAVVFSPHFWFHSRWFLLVASVCIPHRCKCCSSEICISNYRNSGLP